MSVNTAADSENGAPTLVEIKRTERFAPVKRSGNIFPFAIYMHISHGHVNPFRWRLVFRRHIYLRTQRARTNIIRKDLLLIALRLLSSFERAPTTRLPIYQPPIAKMIEIRRPKLSSAIFVRRCALVKGNKRTLARRTEKCVIHIWIRFFPPGLP